jgi:sugar/nucleoside kinase (ribokinase family)
MMVNYQINMYPDIISLGELLVEIIRSELDTPHSTLGATYKGPFPSGAPAIFIDSAARIGKKFRLSTGFIGAIGDDEFGKCILTKLKKDEVDTSQIKVLKEFTTGIAFNQYNSDGSRKFIFAPGAAGMILPKDLEKKYFLNIKALHIMGSALSISEMSRRTCYEALKIAKEVNPEVIISFDPNLRPEMLNIDIILDICRPVLEQTNVLMPSGKEAEMLAGISNEERACIKLLNKGPKVIALKQGKNGCTIFSNEFNKIRVSGFKVNEIDPTGAGDSFGGAFIVGYLEGWDIEKVARFANAVGALKIQSFGPMSDTSYDDVLKFLRKS